MSLAADQYNACNAVSICIIKYVNMQLLSTCKIIFAFP